MMAARLRGRENLAGGEEWVAQTWLSWRCDSRSTGFPEHSFRYRRRSI